MGNDQSSKRNLQVPTYQTLLKLDSVITADWNVCSYRGSFTHKLIIIFIEILSFNTTSQLCQERKLLIVFRLQYLRK